MPISHTQCPFGCGSSDAYTENEDKGIGKCFSCGKIKHLGKDFAHKSVTYYPEFQAEYNSHPQNICNIEWEALRKYAIFYTTKLEVNGYIRTNQLVLPCYLDEQYRGCQLKSLNAWEHIKYISLKNEPLIYCTTQKTKHIHSLVITEDWLSAIQIHECCPQFEALALLGTKLSRRSAIYKFIQKTKPKHIYIWLDNDAPGHEGAISVDKLLGNTFYSTIVHSKEEAKNLTKEQIRERLHE